MACPMPVLAPVTTATLPERSKGEVMILSFLLPSRLREGLGEGLSYRRGTADRQALPRPLPQAGREI
ncbi:hypothetical protein HMP06_2003 [Sphingomonas sp. HMP6]|nr:hypothetical protein HMP06_2003 [Sphingomonas sp. HMP6]